MAPCCDSPSRFWRLRWFCSELAPLRIALATGPSLAIKTSSALSGADTGKTRMGKIIVALQMTVCVVLLVAAGLLDSHATRS